ncbi:ABC transporter ATP-binding protein [Falsarthrobacter nasiphocae]|uniref:ABC transport system ATP-binding protein n=1 Tax=Falsarthrobacter nasiphocae TaxID=189863 RepID=A0AAE3YHZ0_9MICC|nr:ATP-binding cassette domain-containing protein [Falsarthrobacter nasiphocae]MDR6892096.1 putative ABC transport system ATP-binding protein [Falsarthrobacter nasiphocae]
MPTALDLSHVTLTYPDGAGRLTAVDDASLTIRRGELVGLVGPSGSGKSSLLSLASTLQRPTTGEVTVDGTPTSALSTRELLTLRREKIGIIFQQPQLIESLTAREQLLITESIRGGKTRGARGRADELLDLVGLSGQADRRPGQLSGGQRQRVNIARALMGQPALLLVDEPTSALDRERSASVVALLEKVTREFETGTLLVTHETETLGNADRVLHMEDGRLSPSL